MRIDHPTVPCVDGAGRRWLWVALPLTVLVLVLLPTSSGAQSGESSTCGSDLGTLSGTTGSTQVSGTIAADANCTSSQRDPDDSDSVYYARRHTFTLGAAATMSAWVSSSGDSQVNPYMLLIEGSSVDGSGTVLSRGDVWNWVLAAGTYTVEATTSVAEDTGAYTVNVNWAPVDACLRDMGALDSTTTSASVSGVIAVDPGCTSSQRDPDDSETVYHARRHSFTLAEAATVWLEVSPSSARSYVLLIEGASADGSGEVVARFQGRDRRCGRWSWSCTPGAPARSGYLLLGAGTYTVEASMSGTGPYSARVEWAAADACLRDLGALGSASPSALGSGIVAVDSSCMSPSRAGDGTDVYYARRHTFTLAEAATVSVQMAAVPVRGQPASLQSHVTLIAGASSNGSGTVIRADSSWTGYWVLDAGTYTVEASSHGAGQTGLYSVQVDWAPVDDCVRDLGSLSASAATLSGSGIVAVDSSCMSPSRAGDGTDVYYARRHTFTLAGPAAVSAQVTPPGARWHVTVIDGASSDGSGTVAAREQGKNGVCTGRWVTRCTQPEPARSGYLLLDAGTYTVEATPDGAGETGVYQVQVDWAPVDDCVRDLGTLSASAATLSGSGTIAKDAECTSPSRAGDSAEVHYVRRHRFTLDAAATVTVEVAPAARRSFLSLVAGDDPNGTGALLGTARGSDAYRPLLSFLRPSRPARLVDVPLGAGTYMVEASKNDAGDTGPYSVSVEWAPYWRDVTVTDATASEGDEAVVLTVEAVLPDGAVSEVAPAHVSWSTVPDTAVESSDFVRSSSTATIPAGRDRATITVPLVDDAVSESAESFSVRLGSSGAVLNRGTATATITDDDPAPSAPVPSVSVCTGGTVSGVVGDVFDVVQSGYAEWTDVFVDVELSCAGGSAGSGGYRTGVEVVYGAAAPRASSWCVRGGISPVTEPAVNGCAARATESVLSSARAVAAHIVRIPDTAVSEPHQLRVWIDLDHDGARGAGEPQQIFAADFASRAPAAGGGVRFALAEDFEVSAVSGSDRIGRAGQWVTLRLFAEIPTGEFAYDPALSTVAPVRVPLANARLGTSIYTGPSSAASVMCVAPPVARLAVSGRVSACVTDADGMLTVRYRVRAPALTATGPQQDDLRVWWDRNANGAHDGTPNHPAREPSDTVRVPIAKAAVSYVALGDSYSAGEAGDTPPSRTSYQSGVSPADGECRRWSEAYPVVFTGDFLRSKELAVDAEFMTFACTGAISLNVFDAADPAGVSTVRGHLDTNRPSPAAVSKFLRPVRPGGPSEVVTPGGWEPRQAVSLAGVQSMSGVDMVTITIGGNDAEFGRGILLCALVTLCDPAPSAARLVEIENQIVAALAEVKRVAPDAVVFVMGYPYLTPEVDSCALPELVRRNNGRQVRYELSFEGLPAGCEQLWREHSARVDECESLSATGALRGSLYYVGGTVLHTLVGSEATRIDYWEAKAMWAAADALNGAVRSAAARAGAHFVDVVGDVPIEDAPRGFVGHSSCNTAEPWVHGFRAKTDFLRDQSGADGSSFHPTTAGQDAYARILEAYIRGRIAAGAPMSEAGLPLAPAPTSGASGGSGPLQSAAGPAGGAGEEAGGQTDAASAVPSAGLLVPQAATSVSGCGEPFVSPGGKVTLAAAGFAADAAVTFSAQAASLGTAQLTAPQIAAATADSDGMISTAWTVPTAPAASVDPAPRAYLIDASGLNASRGTHTGLMGLPLVAYPGTAPCAVADTASTTLGTAVQIAVLANDIAPTKGSLNAASVVVRDAPGGTFAANETTGAVTFTPDAGFWGTVETTYVVYDGWGIGVEADLTVSVNAGCTVTGTVGTALIEGTDGDDVLCVPDRDDWRAFHIMDGKGGDDVILGGDGEEWIYGGAGADTIYANGGDDRIVAGTGTDTVHGGPGMDSIYSTDLADTVVDDVYELVLSPAAVVGQSGPAAEDDWVWVGVSEAVEIDVLGNDHDPNGDLAPGSLRITVPPTLGAAAVSESADGRTVVEYTASAAAGSDSFAYEVCDSLGNCATAEATVVVGAVCTITGTEGDDTLWGTPGDDVICGLGGDDVIHGQGGNDVLIGGPGNDNISGGQGDDVLVGGAGDDYGSGGRGDDTVWGGVGDDALYGDDGDDTVWGGDGSDNLSGNDGDDRISAGAGDDIVWGYAGNDRIWGGPGADRIWGGMGDDTLWGGAGKDALRAGVGDDVLWGGPGADTLEGAAGTDTLHGGTGSDRVDGGDGTDVLWGGIGDDMLWGRDHNDQLHGGPGTDTLRGGPGDDRLWGGPGNDILIGNSGTDHLDGGDGTDTCTRATTTAHCEPLAGSRP